MLPLNFKIACLMEICLNQLFSSQNICPKIYTVPHSDRDCHTNSSGGGALPAVSEAVFGVTYRSHLQYFQECVWVEITVTDGYNLFTDNHFTPDIKADIIKKLLQPFIK
jgi:hypothetical protein